MSTLDEVATLAGVSKATVSRVINQRGNVHPDTVRAVRAALSRTRYEPPLFKTGRPSAGEGARESKPALSVYALVVPEIAGGLYVSLLGGFEAAANERYRQSLVCNTNNNVFKQGHELLQLLHKRVAGVAVVPVGGAPTPVTHIEALQADGIPVVLLHRDVAGADCPLIALPLEQVAYAAGRAILDKGHRRAALMTMPPGPSSDLHLSGLRRALEESGLPLPSALIKYCAALVPYVHVEAEASVSRAIDELLALPVEQRPTALYATNDTLAELVYMQLLNRGLHVPGEMSVVSFGGQQRIGAIAGRLTAVVVDESAVGRLAVEVLENKSIAHGEPRLVQYVPIALTEGMTL